MVLLVEGRHQGLTATRRREYTADELDDLPKGSCAWDEDGDIWQHRAASWVVAGGYSFHNPLRDGVIAHAYSAPEAGEQA